MKNDLLLLWNLLFGLFLTISVSEAARATTLILGKSKPDPKTGEVEVIVQSSWTTTEEPGSLNNTITVGNTTVKLTGNPQIDYIHDPNLPRELNGFNLTDYPFFVTIPPEIDFKCDGLHDGFYASVTHKCQVYHHCLFGTRYDFLCANYTAFDQKTFICHFASEVDCKNSPKYFKRNEALYKQLSTTTTTLPPPVAPPGGKRSGGGRRRRPSRRRKPTYDYYDDYGEYDDDYEDSGTERRNKKPRPESDSVEGPVSDDDKLPTGPNKSLYDRPRVAPKVRRPVPINEREKYDYTGETRLLPPKESSHHDSSKEEEEKTDNNRKLKDKPKAESKGKDRESERDRDRYRETDKERNRGSDDREEDYDRVRVRERDRPRGREDEYERDKKTDRDRPRSRDEDRDRDEERDRPRIRDDDRERDRDIDRDRPRDRRPAKKRRRPDSYAGDYYEDDYEDIRRPRPRDRPYDDEEDYEYDDRYYRKPLRARDRIRERERERPYRNKERDYESKSGKNHRTKDYDDEEESIKFTSRETEERNKSSEKGKGNRARDNERYDDKVNDRDRPKANNQKDLGEGKKVPTSDERVRKTVVKPVQKEEELSKSDEGYYYDDEDVSDRDRSSADRSQEEETKEEVPDNKPKHSIQRAKVSTEKPTTAPFEPDKPIPATRPSYITQLNVKVVKKYPEGSPRKPAGFRRNQQNATSKEPALDDVLPLKESSVETTKAPSFRGQYERSRSKASPQPFTTKASIRPTEPTVENKPDMAEQPQRQVVPSSEVVDSEELAPRAPKRPTMSSKRRPFLPSRGGDPTLLRGLTSVGAKAFTAPKKEDDISESTELSRPSPTPNSRERFNTKPNENFESTRFPAGIEFRTRLTANLGVEQPRLTPSFQEDVPSADIDYSGEIADSREISQETPKVINVRPAVNVKPLVPLRSTLKTTDFPQLSHADAQRDIKENSRNPQQTSEESRERKYLSQISNGNYNPLPTLHDREIGEPLQQQQRVFQQLGPQTFYSDNPKFKTAVTLVEPPRPTPTNVNYNPGTHLPNYYQPVLKTGQGQVQVVHLQKPLEYSTTPVRKPVAVKFPQPGNLEETDEYDVSFNDALQPISSLHPRNAQTGLLGSQRNNGPRRRYSVENGDNSNNKKRVIGQRLAESNIQPQFAVPPLRPFQQQGDFFPIFS